MLRGYFFSSVCDESKVTQVLMPGQSGWFPESYVEDINAAAAFEPSEALETKTQLEGE